MLINISEGPASVCALEGAPMERYLDVTAVLTSMRGEDDDEKLSYFGYLQSIYMSIKLILRQRLEAPLTSMWASN